MTTVARFVAAVNDAIINPILAFLFAAALLYFFYGGLKLILGAGSDEQRNIGKRHMFWGVVGMVIMVAVFAILRIGLYTLGVGPGNLPPELPLSL